MESCIGGTAFQFLLMLNKLNLLPISYTRRTQKKQFINDHILQKNDSGCIISEHCLCLARTPWVSAVFNLNNHI